MYWRASASRPGPDSGGARAVDVQLRVVERRGQQHRVELEVVLDVDLLLAALHFVQRRLRDVDVAALDEQRNLAIEEREQQRADVRTVDVRVRHDDDAVIAQLVDVEVVAADAAAERGDQRADFRRLQHLVEARLLDVQDLALERQDGLRAAIATLLGGATCRVTLDDEDFAERRIFFLAVGEFAGQARDVERALAARHFARFSRGFARTRGVDDLADDGLRFVRML